MRKARGPCLVMTGLATALAISTGAVAGEVPPKDRCEDPHEQIAINCTVGVADGWIVGELGVSVRDTDGDQVAGASQPIAQTGATEQHDGEPVDAKTEDTTIFQPDTLCLPVVGCNEDPISAPAGVDHIKLVEDDATYTVRVNNGAEDPTATVTVQETCADPGDDPSDCKRGGTVQPGFVVVQPG